uniref:DUF4408 domain-containing protein n=1 Tax=Rhabditophanes sp. KR3021 TaxID=114890 RepID=A0AC35U2T5_9BILA
MGWFCFRFWLVYRFSLALLAHFNFGISLEVGCVFFCLWKAFDLMWFWIHFLLCICVPALRPENYLLVVINLIWSGLTTHTGRSYKQIYNDLYNWKKSKSERELKRIKNLEKNKETSKDSDSEDDDIQDLPTSGQSLPNTNKDNESARLYPDLPEVERDIDSDSSSGEFDDENGDLEETLGTEKAYYKSTRPMIRKKQEDNVSDKISIKGVFDKIHLKKMNPLNMLKKNENKGEEDKEKEKLKAENEELKKQAKEMKDLEKEKMKQQKAERKELAKLLREKRKVELEAIAKVEKKRRKIANIIELSLNAWRMMASFAILVGNCRKTFLPSECVRMDEDGLMPIKPQKLIAALTDLYDDLLVLMNGTLQEGITAHELDESMNHIWETRETLNKTLDIFCSVKKNRERGEAPNVINLSGENVFNGIEDPEHNNIDRAEGFEDNGSDRLELSEDNGCDGYHHSSVSPEDIHEYIEESENNTGDNQNSEMRSIFLERQSNESRFNIGHHISNIPIEKYVSNGNFQIDSTENVLNDENINIAIPKSTGDAVNKDQDELDDAVLGSMEEGCDVPESSIDDSSISENPSEPTITTTVSSSTTKYIPISGPLNQHDITEPLIKDVELKSIANEESETDAIDTPTNKSTAKSRKRKTSDSQFKGDEKRFRSTSLDDSHIEEILILSNDEIPSTNHKNDDIRLIEPYIEEILLSSDDDDIFMPNHTTLSSRTNTTPREPYIEEITISSEDETCPKLSFLQPKKKDRPILTEAQLEQSTKEAMKLDKQKRVSFAAHFKKKGIKYKKLEEKENVYDTKVSEILLDDNKDNPVSVHPTFTKVLKKHQAEGIDFLYFSTIESVDKLDEAGTGACLAYFMSLGKTFITIAYLHTVLTHQYISKKLSKGLILVPKNVHFNWKSEFKQWQSILPPSVQKIKVFDLYDNGNRLISNDVLRLRTIERWFENKDPSVFIMGNDIFIRLLRHKDPNVAAKYKQFLINPGPDIVVIDEAHAVKNSKTHIAKFVNSFRTLRRIALTGTPVQNNLKEYFCIINFVRPGILGTFKEFSNRYMSVIERGSGGSANTYQIREMTKRYAVLWKLLEYTVHRRDGKFLDETLPPKNEFVIHLRCTDKQAMLFKKMSQFMVEAKQSSQKTMNHHFDFLSKATAIACHPYSIIANCREYAQNMLAEKAALGNDEEADLEIMQYEADMKQLEGQPKIADCFKDVENLFEKKDEFNVTLSSKLLFLVELLKQAEREGDKVLVFFNYNFTLKYVARVLEHLMKTNQWYTSKHELPPGRNHRYGWNNLVDYAVINGETSAIDRSSIQEAFNDPREPRKRLILLVTRAGGIGMNMVGFNRAVLFESNCNPALDLQALHRIYRINQKKQSYFYRLLVDRSIEKIIHQEQIKKESTSLRTIDKHTIRSNTNSDKANWYLFVPQEPIDTLFQPTLQLPNDDVFARIMLANKDIIVNYVPKDSLLQNRTEEALTEVEIEAEWKIYEEENEKMKSKMNSRNGIRNVTCKNYYNFVLTPRVRGEDSDGLSKVSEDFLKIVPHENILVAPLHLSMRVFALIREVLIKNLSTEEKTRLDSNFFDLSTTAAQYWQKFSRKSAAKVLKNAQDKDLPNGGIIVAMKQLLEYLAIISHLSGPEELTDEQLVAMDNAINGIKRVTKLEVCKDVKVSPYLHMLDHFMPQVQRLRCVSFFSDQCSENIHGYMHRDTNRVTTPSCRARKDEQNEYLNFSWVL